VLTIAQRCGTLLFLVRHHLQADQTPLAAHGDQAGALNRNQCGPCPAAPLQLGLREGIHDFVQSSWAHPLSGRLPPLLRGKKSREEALSKPQQGGGESSPNSLPTILLGLQREVL